MQMGMSKLGCEIIFHKTVTCSQLHPEFDRVFIDATNAFHEARRDKILDKLIIHFPELVGHFRRFYEKAANLVREGEIIEAATGVKQGDVMAPLFYALSTSQLLTDANALEPREDGQGFVAAY